ncbi:hypothetical protein BDR22DRAFT_194677 [Usnea florida]
MSGSEGSYDGSTPDASASRPRVNLPAMAVQRNFAPYDGYYMASAEPNAVSLNNYFPSLPATPQVNIPIRQAHTHQSSIAPQSSASDISLEHHLRGMILSNGIPRTHTVHDGSYSSHQQASRRPNQAQRRQQMVQLDRNVSISAPLNDQPPHRVSRALDSARDHLLPQVPNLQYQAPHWQSRSPHPGNQAYGRPLPTNRPLYNPGPYGVQSQRTGRSQNQPSRASPETQVAYLWNIAQFQIAQSEISREEFLEKQALRQSLEKVCRDAVTEYELNRDKDGAFEPDSVELKCFGSLSTTFATKSSDMDLVLVSPMSTPETSSPDSDLPRLIEKALLDLGYGARLLTRTRVPIIRFCEKPSPELATLLLAERKKYEKERDAPPPAPKAQKPPKKEEKNPEKPDSTGPENQPTDVAPDNAVPELKASKIGKPDEHRDHNASKRAGSSASSPPDTTQTTGGAQSNVAGEEQSKKVTDDRERDDPSLIEKTDAERARLYRLAIQDGWYEPEERRIINNFLSAFERHGALKPDNTQLNEPHIGTSVMRNTDFSEGEELQRMRAALQDLPNILRRYRPPPAAHPLDFPKEGVGIQCDINFSNHLALHNSHLLKCYASCDPRVRQMVLFVKAWSKKRKINTPYHGTLSSYGYVLMVLHYLVNVANPPVVPNLQTVPLMLQDEMSAKEVSLEGYNIQFFRNEEKILDLAHRGQLTFNQESLGSLLRGFFRYFAQQGYGSPLGGFAWSQDTLSLRTIGGIISKQAKGWTGAKTETIDLSGPGPQTKEIRQRYLFAIEDPFEINHNIARTVVHNGIVAIRDEFRRAHLLIQNAGVIPGKGHEDLFAEAEERDNLQYRPFGPRPKKVMAPGQNGGKKGNGTVPGQKDGRPTIVETLTKQVKQEDGGKGGAGSNQAATI